MERDYSYSLEELTFLSRSYPEATLVLVGGIPRMLFVGLE